MFETLMFLQIGTVVHCQGEIKRDVYMATLATLG